MPFCPQTFLGDSSKILAILSENPGGPRPDGREFCPKSYRTVWAFIRGPGTAGGNAYTGSTSSASGGSVINDGGGSDAVVTNTGGSK